MADDKTKTGKPDRDRINVEEDYELRYWAEKFDVTSERLKAAVKTSGPIVKDMPRCSARASRAAAASSIGAAPLALHHAS
jgi:hypothetical protein